MNKPILSYDESEIIDSQVEYIISDENEKGRSEEEIRIAVYENYDLFKDEWDRFEEYLGELLNEIDKNKFEVFKVVGKSMGWRNLEGYKTIKAENGEELLKGILPKTNEFSLYVWKTKTQIKIKCSHHDSPMGEWYLIKPLNKVKFKEYESEEYY